MSECKRCGRDLHRAMILGWPHKDFPIVEMFYSDLPKQESVVVPTKHLKEANAQLKELGEFAAWVCGVTFETLCRADMLNYLEKKLNEQERKL